MTNSQLDQSLATLNTARTILNPDVVYIQICGDNKGVEVYWLAQPTAPGGGLSHVSDTLEEAAQLISAAIGENGTMVLCSDHRDRWVLIPRD